MATQIQESAASQKLVLDAAAQHWGIPSSILKGVYGMETAFGTNVTTSSGGAKGAFQFIQSTASKYNYPWTNDTGGGTFQQQADAAAHYLSDLYHQHGGNWDAALRAYSGTGYGLAQVQAKSGGKLSGSDLAGPAKAAVDIAKGAAGAASSVGDLVGMVTSGAFWLRVLEVLAGVALLAMGLMSLSGRTTTPVSVAKGAAKNASKAAVAL
jgi:soluble lytic murein transglycosylase-like protein